MPSCNTYHLTWVSLTLDEGYLLTTAPPNLERGIAPWTLLHPRSHCSLDVGLLLLASAPSLGSWVALELFKFNFFNVTGCGIDLGYCHIERFTLEMNRDHSIVFEIASKYCISDSFVNCDGYSFSSKGFLPTVVDIMVI